MYEWLGRFHILAVHFPIALIVMAALGEAAALFLRESKPWAPVRFCLIPGALAALVSAVLGTWHADLGGFGSMTEVIEAHRQMGYATAIVAGVAAIASEFDAAVFRRRTWATRVIVVLAAVLVCWAAHLGGLSVYGPEYFTSEARG